LYFADRRSAEEAIRKFKELKNWGTGANLSFVFFEDDDDNMSNQ